MIRSFIGIVFVVLYCIVSVPILLVQTVRRKKHPYEAEIFMLKLVQRAFKILLFICGTTVNVKGLENIPEDEAVLFVGNHQSFFDIIISYSQMKTRCGYIAKDNLEHIPILSWNMKFLFCLFLNRDDLRQGLETIKKAINYIENGISVFIFPEGTRNKTGIDSEIGPFHRGSFKIAQRTGCSIIPVSFNGTADIFEAHFPAVKKTSVTVEYGKPVPYGSLSREEQKQIDEVFRTKIRDMLIKNS